MASSLFQNSNSKTNNTLFNSRDNILQKFQSFKTKMSPEHARQEVERLRTSGKMTEQQYQLLSSIAKSIGGQ